MRILWADDQEDVARTIGTVLGESADIVYIRDGQSALERLLAGRFDVALVDLSMPPGPWGGLWLLEQMLAHDLEVPVIVLSGEGSQTETIRAMRMGADYVRKEDARTELAGRVRDVVERQDRVWSRLESDLPVPVAAPIRRIRGASSDLDRLRRLIIAVEAVTRYRAIIAGAWLRKVGSHLPFELSQLRSPSFGTWVTMAKTAGRSVDEAILSPVRWRSTERIVELRNQLHHGVEPSAAVAQAEYARSQEVLQDLAHGLRRHRLVLPLSLAFDGTLFDVMALRVQGHSPALETESLNVAAPLVTHTPYALVASERLPLHPWIQVIPGAESSSWRVLVLDTVLADKRSAVTGKELIRYVDVWTGERNITTGAVAADLMP